METFDVDDLDLRLIRCLQENPRASYAMIARMSGIPGTTVRRRVEALISSKVITPATLPDLYMVGYSASAMVGLKVDLARIEVIAQQLQSFPEVTFVAITTGRYDVMFFVAQETLEDLTRFMSRQIAAIEGVRDTETLVTPRVLKVLGDWRIPIGDSKQSTRPDSSYSSHHAAHPNEFVEGEMDEADSDDG